MFYQFSEIEQLCLQRHGFPFLTYKSFAIIFWGQSHLQIRGFNQNQ